MLADYLAVEVNFELYVTYVNLYLGGRRVGEERHDGVLGAKHQDARDGELDKLKGSIFNLQLQRLQAVDEDDDDHNNASAKQILR